MPLRLIRCNRLVEQVHEVYLAGSGRMITFVTGIIHEPAALKLLFHDTAMSGNRYFIAQGQPQVRQATIEPFRYARKSSQGYLPGQSARVIGSFVLCPLLWSGAMLYCCAR